MRQRLLHSPFVSNPYVVFADIAISLSFVFLIYALATSQALLKVTRIARQSNLLSQIKADYRHRFPNAVISPEIRKDPSTDHTEEVMAFRPFVGGDIDVEIRTNAGLQRIAILRHLFHAGESKIVNQTARDILFDISQEVAKARNEFTYLFIHGIAEKSESNAKDDVALRLSEARAHCVYDFLVSSQLIGAFQNALRPSRVVSFGTGFNLYPNKESVGRVDLVLFYNDQGDPSGS